MINLPVARLAIAFRPGAPRSPEAHLKLRWAYMLGAGGYVLACLMPLHLLPWVSWHNEIIAFAGVFMAAMAAWAAGGVRSERRLPITPMVVVLWMVPALSFLQITTGLLPYSGDAWVVLLYAALCLFAYWLGFLASQAPAQSESSLEALASVLVAVGIACTYLALFQALELWRDMAWIARTPTLRRSGANLAQPNQMATVLLMALVSLVWLFERGRTGRRGCAALALILAVGLATTESRTGLLGLVLLACFWAFRRHASRLRVRDVAAMVVVTVGLFAVWPMVVESFHGFGTASSASVNTRAGLRLVVWPQLVRAIFDRPWLGWGIGQTASALTSVVARYPESEPYTYAHNIVLEACVAFGIPLALCFSGAAVLWCVRRLRERDSADRWFLMALTIPFAVHSLLEFPYAFAYLLAPVMFAVGQLDGRSQGQRCATVDVRCVAPLAVAVMTLGLITVSEYIEVEEDFRVARFEAANVGATPLSYERPHIRILTQLASLLDATRVQPQKGMPEASIALQRAAAERYPWPPLQNRYAIALALNGHSKAAAQELSRIRSMHGEPLFHHIRIQWEQLREVFPELRSVPLPPA